VDEMDTLIDNIKVCDGVARMTGNEQAHDVLAKARRSCPSSVDGPLPKWAKSVFGSKSRRVGIAHHRVLLQVRWLYPDCAGNTVMVFFKEKYIIFAKI
jgi:hypothetical protein